MEKSTDKGISLEVLAESNDMRKIDPRGSFTIPFRLKKELGLMEGDQYICSLVQIDSSNNRYKNGKAILILPVQVEYKPKYSR